jgi:hypothetical protein
MSVVEATTRSNSISSEATVDVAPAADDSGLFHGYTGAETFLVGISPTFWAHVPMLIRQVQQDLQLIDGVHCLLVMPYHHHPTTTSESAAAAAAVVPKVIPITKCKLLGCIVYAEYKASGCIIYVIDDGTGLVDCLYWDNNEGNDYDGLPSLTGRSDSRMLQPGVMVAVMGRIQCVAVDEMAETTVHVQAAGGIKSCRIRAAVREIHASSVEPITTFTSRATPFSMDHESRHWQDCIRIQQQLVYAAATTPFPTSSSGAMLNALDVLQVLGPDISAQVVDQTNLPAADDTVGAWRLFGTHCKCLNTVVKRDLLYCHCIATPDKMDPEFRYRDRLLEKLLQAELQQQQQPQSDSDEQGTYEHNHHFCFQYRMIISDDELNQIAAEQIRKSTNVGSSYPGQVQQLVRNIFRALRKDGILHLLDAESDTYLLLSRQGVLEPYIRRSLACPDAAARTRFHAARPSYLDAVSRARMQLVRRSLALDNKNDNR